MLPTVAKKTRKIPDYLIYEEIDGKPIYYRGYLSVLNKKNNLESIMGSSELQSYFIMTILEFLLKEMPEKYKIMTSELGIHLAHGSNLAADIAIYEKKVFKDKFPQDKYSERVPLCVIEVDTKADFGNITEADYYHSKTQKLLDFGVEMVVWFFSKSQKVMISRKDHKQWIITDWSEEVEVLGYAFSLKNLLEAEGLDLSAMGK
jgi:Uma2 family endonuclease